MKADLNITFYREKRFKETPIGKIPEDWDVIKLGAILNLKNGERPKISKTGKIPIYGANGVMGFTTEFLIDNDFTIIIGRVGASGEVHLGQGKIWVSDNAIYSENYNKHKTYLPFIYYLLKLKNLGRFATKTTHPIITQTFLKSLSIQLPPLSEQEAIAHVLSTVDEAIQKTDEIIERIKRLKKGLMQELLMKGFTLGFMFDTNIFDKILDGKVKLPIGLRYYVTHIQLDEILNMPESKKERRKKLLETFNRVPKEVIATKGAVYGVSKFGMAEYMSEKDAELYRKMLRRLNELDKRAGKRKSPENQARDILIALTCLKNCITLVTNDKNLKRIAQEFQCPSITFEQLLRGELREFKNTEIGRIPKEWEVVRLGNVLELCQYGLSIKMSDKGKYPIIRMDEIENGYVIPQIAKRVDLDEKTFRAFKLEKGDILFNRTNSYELVGRTGIFLLDGDYVFASYLIRLRVKRSVIDPRYLTFYMIFSHDRLRQLATQAVHQANINATNLKKFKIPLPPLEEQRKIAEILSTVDKRLEVERKRKEKLERIKKGLMDLLLTGKIRVEVS